MERGDDELVSSDLCTPETPTLSDLAESIDDTLFERIMHNPYHVIHHLLPPRRELSYKGITTDN